jgi:hypothetical protein
MMADIILEKHLNIFSNPARIIVSGMSSSGKSITVSNLLEKYHHMFDRIVISGVDTFPVKSQLDQKLSIMKTIYDPFSDDIHPLSETQGNTLIIYDDLQFEALRSPVVSNVFTKGRHLKLSVCLILQNILASGSRSRDISLNATHFILLKMRDRYQIQCLARQIFGTDKSKTFAEMYDKYVTKKRFGHLLVDLTIDKPDVLSVRTDIDTNDMEKVITF